MPSASKSAARVTEGRKPSTIEVLGKVKPPNPSPPKYDNDAVPSFVVTTSRWPSALKSPVVTQTGFNEPKRE